MYYVNWIIFDTFARAQGVPELSLAISTSTKQGRGSRPEQDSLARHKLI